MSSEGEIRLLAEDEMAEAVRLADSVFRQDGRISMGLSLPQVFSPALGQAIGCFLDGRLVSLAGMVPSIVRIGAARLRIFSYGAVCTHPDFRGRGLAGTILQFAKQHARQSGASLLLVSGELPLYTKAGCYRFGMTRHYRLGQKPGGGMALPKEFDFREAAGTDWFHLYELAAGREIASEMSLWDMAELLRSGALASVRRMHHQTYMAEKDGAPVAFCTVAVKDAENAARAGEGLAIEWAGDAAAIASLLGHLVPRLNLRQLELAVPWHDPLLEQLQPGVFEQFGEGTNPGTLHIVDEQQLFQQLAPYWQKVTGSGDDGPHLDRTGEGKATISLNGNTTPALDHDRLLHVLFGRWGEPEPLNSEWMAKLKPYFPLPYPYTKGLNFV